MPEQEKDRPLRISGAPGYAALRREWVPLLLPLLWVVWLAALGTPLSSLLAAPLAPARLGAVLSGIATFVAVYLWMAWHNTLRVPAPSARRWPIAALAALSLALTLGAGPPWLVLFIFTSASAAGYLPLRPAVLAIGTLVGLAAIAGLLSAAPGALLAETLIRVATVGLAIASLTRAVLMGRELQAARADIARLAVAEERLRFARDLHDLLGHGLSLIALKTELAERLVPTAPERATSEIRDAQTVARSALHEVREAVAGDSQPTLASELQGAADLLVTAGIAYQGPPALGPLPVAVDATLAWAVREGVTNVIRHAPAHQCAIAVRRTADAIVLELTNDGSSAPGAAPRSAAGARRAPGSGLTGLRERVRALGGHCEAGPLPAGSFRLTVSLPLEPRIGTTREVGADAGPELGADRPAPGRVQA